MQKYIEAHTGLEQRTGDVVALVGFGYRHHEVIRQLHSAQHAYQDIILHTGHPHQGEWCLESLFCRGEARLRPELINRLRYFDAGGRVKMKGIRSEPR